MKYEVKTFRNFSHFWAWVSRYEKIYKMAHPKSIISYQITQKNPKVIIYH